MTMNPTERWWLTPDRQSLATTDPSVSRDLLRGAREIAVFLFGEGAARRRIYDLHAEGALPTFTIGGSLYARRSSLMKWIEDKERRSPEEVA